MWKNRNELPSLVKLDLQVDIERLRKEVSEYIVMQQDCMEDGPYKNLRDAYGYNLSRDAYNKTNEEVDSEFDWAEIPYKQVAVTEYDENYTVRKDRNSGKRYDRGFMKNDKRFDERAYSKIKDDVPPYLREVISLFGENTARVCIATTEPNGGIKPHRDYDTTFCTRYHIAINTNEKATVNDMHIPSDGSVWFLNAGKNHWVKNEGSESRTHLLIMVDGQEPLNEYEWLEVYDNEQ